MTRKIEDVLVDDGIASGIYADVDGTQHHARSRLSPSTITPGLVDHENIDPAAVKFAFEERREFTAATQDRMDRGSLAHFALLQPEKLVTHVAVWHGGKRAGAEWNEFEAENAKKLIVRRDDYDEVMKAVERLQIHKEVNELLSDGDAEVEMLTKEGRLHCSGQVDFVSRGRCRIVDLKTTDAGISDRSLEYTIRDLRYREKMSAYAVWYGRESGREVEQCWNLFIRLKEPVAIVAKKFTTQALEWGWSRMLETLNAVDRCLDEGWPIYFKSDIADVAQWELGDDEIEGI